MRVGIIGAGNIGTNLTRRLTAIGHTVVVANSRSPETLADLARTTGAMAVTAAEAPRDAELVVVTIPMKAVTQLSPGILDSRKAGAPVIDTSNYYPQQRDGRIAEIEDGMPESEWVSKVLGVSVIKAFNGIYADHICSKARDKGDPERIALPVAGDDQEDKRLVMDLIDEMGFDPVDAGSLSDSWRQQPGTPAYGHYDDPEGIRQALADARPERTADWRAKP